MDKIDQLEDTVLVLRSQTGERAAFDELVERWQNRLWRHAYCLTGDRDAAWDAVQETWFAVIRGIRKLEDARAFPRWVFAILRNQCADWVTRQQRRRRLADRLKPDSVSDGAERTTATRIDVQTALAGLDAQQREVVSLHYVQDLGTKEIAEVLGIPEGTVKSRLYYAREELRRILEKADE